jgi:hypothetical protein
VVAGALESGTFPDSGLPVGEILVLAGFLAIYLLEETLHALLVKCRSPLYETRAVSEQCVTCWPGSDP